MDIFTTTLGLTKQINGFELAGYLIDRIKQEFDPIDVDVFEVFGVSGDYSEQDIPDVNNITVRRFNYTGDIQRKSSDLTEFHQAIVSGNPLIVNDEENNLEKIVIPVPSKCGPLRLVVTSGVDESPMQRLTLFQTVEIFNNLIMLHDSHERDKLTGLMNRQTLYDFYTRTFERDHGDDHKLFIGVCDIDHFKRINDTFGHLSGDKVLLDFAKIMENSFRYNDALFRFGGEEFIVLFRCENQEIAKTILNRFRESVQQYLFGDVGHVTVSIGFAESEPESTANALIGKADIALYYAKGNGRNQVISYDDIETETPTHS
jgi:diguanylate cyclase (GGDEF)-like protein